MIRTIVFTLFAAGICGAGERTAPPPQGELVLWRAPRAISGADWIWGPGGEQAAPAPPFRFVKENLGGTTPKVDVRDARGRSWTVKFGGEVHTEVFMSRLLYATGYAAEPAYFVPAGVIEGTSGLRRAKPFIGKDGTFQRARFKLRDRRWQYADEYQWSWTDNPFLHSRQLNGLRILMMLVSNWDAKDARDAEGSNTAVFRQRDAQSPVYLYAMTDWGSTLGSWGGFFKRGRWNAEEYERQTPNFIKGVKDGTIEWGYSGKHARDITEGITTDDARWILQYLAPITDEQLRSGLIASGATAADAERFRRAIRNRIEQLQRVAEINSGVSNAITQE